MTAVVAKRQLLVTMTGEPLQPIRLYYDVANKAAVVRAFAPLRCVLRAGTDVWNWQYEDEASVLEFARPRAELPPEVHPIILGQFRFPTNDRAVLSVRSADRAIAAAKFFAPLFATNAVLRRARVLNRYLDASENALGLGRIDRLLDQEVVTVDPSKAEAEIEAAISKGRTPAEKLKAYSEHAAERRKRDVPLVEDFPLWPEEETADFRDLTMTLQLRTLRAHEHWNGNTHLTLADVIHLVVEKGGRGLSVGQR